MKQLFTVMLACTLLAAMLLFSACGGCFGGVGGMLKLSQEWATWTAAAPSDGVIKSDQIDNYVKSVIELDPVFDARMKTMNESDNPMEVMKMLSQTSTEMNDITKKNGLNGGLAELGWIVEHINDATNATVKALAIEKFNAQGFDSDKGLVFNPMSDLNSQSE